MHAFHILDILLKWKNLLNTNIEISESLLFFSLNISHTPLISILTKNKLNEDNFWERKHNLLIVLNCEKHKFILDEQIWNLEREIKDENFERKARENFCKFGEIMWTITLLNRSLSFVNST